MEKKLIYDFKPRTQVFKKYFFVYITIVLLIASFLVGLLVGQKTENKNKTEQAGEKYLDFKDFPSYLSDKIDTNLYKEVWENVKENYVGAKDVSDEKLFYGSLEGIVGSLGDPYSVFFDPETAKKFEDDLSGTFEGIGAEIGMRNNQLTVIAPLDDTPAQKAGLMAGDYILAINKEDTENMSVDEAVNKIRGEKDTTVVLSIFRESFEQPKDFTIVRGQIDVPSVKWEMKGKNGYIEISHFNDDTDKLFSQAVTELLAKNPKGIILDLRNDPGGYLDSAVNISSYWIENQIVVYERFSDNSKEIKYPSTGKPKLKDIKTVVLINEGSASGSEIVAGALQDFKKATLVGKKTFGKGSVQNYVQLDDGSALKLTVANWFTPNNRQISKIGIPPDVEVDLTLDDINKDKDPQMDKAVELLK